ncbi:MAG: hypothetical protein ACLTCB_01665 [Merdibacter sp.]
MICLLFQRIDRVAHGKRVPAASNMLVILAVADAGDLGDRDEVLGRG